MASFKWFTNKFKDAMAEFRDHSPSSERLHALDAVRGFALLLGILVHASLSFVPTRIPFWIIEDSHPSIALTIFCYVMHLFRMTTFFLIAGFFSHLSFHRRGARDFIRDRLQRIAIPFVIGWAITSAAISLLNLW